MFDTQRNDPNVRGVVRVGLPVLAPQTGVLFSCRAGEFSFEHKSLGQGHSSTFFAAVIEGLRGGAANADGQVTWDGLCLFVRTHVPPVVRKLFGKHGGEQQPDELSHFAEPVVLAALGPAIDEQMKYESKGAPLDSPRRNVVDQLSGYPMSHVRRAGIAALLFEAVSAIVWLGAVRERALEPTTTSRRAASWPF